MERSKDWMTQAEGGLAHAHHDLDHAFYDWACFSAQQSAGKGAKAVLYRLGAEPWGHSVADLLEELHRGVSVLAEALPLREVTLFGSWAAGRATAFSDVDLLVIYSGPEREDAYKTVRRCIPLRGLEPHVYTEDQATSLRSTLDRMTRTSIRLL